MAMHKPKKQKRFQDGGDVNEAEMKQRGLDASNKEAPVGFFERLRMGNIDDPNSEAYKKFGAGRGRAESAPESAPAAAPAATRTVAPAATSAGPAAGTSSLRDPQQMAASKASVGMDESDRRREDAANAPSRATTSSSSSGTKPVTSVQPVTSGTKPKSGIVTKEQLEKSGFTNLRDYLNDQKKLDRRDGKAPERKANGSGSKPATTTSKPATKPATTTSKPAGAQAPRTSGNAVPEASQKRKTASEYSRDADEMRNLTRQKAAVMAFPSAVYDTDTDRMKNKSRKEARFQGSKRMANTPEAQAKRKAMEKGQALERVSPEEYIGPAFGLKTLNKLAKNLATPKVKEYNPKMLPAPKAAAKTDTKALPAPQQKLSYDKGSVKAGERTRRAESRNTQMQKDNDARYGVDTASKGYNPSRSKTGESRFNIGRGETKKSSTEVVDVTSKSTTPKPAPKKRSPRLMSEKKAKAATIGLGAAGVGSAAGAYAEKMVREKRDRDSEVGMKKGGRVTASSASKRADGIAQRGKTRGRMY